jgi:hypothetical protein
MQLTLFLVLFSSFFFLLAVKKKTVKYLGVYLGAALRRRGDVKYALKSLKVP